MTKEQLIKYLRLSVDILDPESQEKDSLYLKMSDEDILLCIDVARTHSFADESLEDFPDEYVYPLMLLAKKEFYLTLAIKHASYVDMMADDNNQLKKSQWFDHYMKLVSNMDDAYNDYLEGGGTGGYMLTSANVTLPRLYYTDYNYENEPLPYVKAKADNVTQNSIEVSWKSTCNRFLCFKVYVSTDSLDYYDVHSDLPDTAKEVVTIRDPHIKRCRISGCNPNSTYYVIIMLTDWAGRTVYSEVEATTLSDTVSDETDSDMVDTTL